MASRLATVGFDGRGFARDDGRSCSGDLKGEEEVIKAAFEAFLKVERGYLANVAALTGGVAAGRPSTAVRFVAQTEES
jgi:hypothetical protein